MLYKIVEKTVFVDTYYVEANNSTEALEGYKNQTPTQSFSDTIYRKLTEEGELNTGI